nr:PREDICTED: uncharacterized protein LOC106705073 [Latimeria chalumnae]|eukprot:XP_014349147.1 PREDICTED: uncharacterized protein LOC106705073 [Latimeria chalumnae]
MSDSDVIITAVSLLGISYMFHALCCFLLCSQPRSIMRRKAVRKAATAMETCVRYLSPTRFQVCFCQSLRKHLALLLGKYAKLWHCILLSMRGLWRVTGRVMPMHLHQRFIKMSMAIGVARKDKVDHRGPEIIGFKSLEDYKEFVRGCYEMIQWLDLYTDDGQTFMIRVSNHQEMEEELSAGNHVGCSLNTKR